MVIISLVYLIVVLTFHMACFDKCLTVMICINMSPNFSVGNFKLKKKKKKKKKSYQLTPRIRLVSFFLFQITLQNDRLYNERS